MNVILGDSGIATQLNTPEFEALRTMLNRGGDMAAMARMLEFPERLNMALSGT